MWSEQHDRVKLDMSRMASVLIDNVDPSVMNGFLQHQQELFNSLTFDVDAKALYPSNLRGVPNLSFEDIVQIVMNEGIALYGLPRAAIAAELVSAPDFAVRQKILIDRRHEIIDDCRGVLDRCQSPESATATTFALSAINTLESGHVDAAQALIGSLADTQINKRFTKKERLKLTRNGKTKTNEAYEEFALHEYIAFAPTWEAYHPFWVQNGDPIPTKFNRHATVHAVSAEQYTLGNTIQGLMYACGLVWRLDQEARRE